MSTEAKAQLHVWLQTALELELATIPAYLMALLSIRLPGNREAAELIRSVMIEEMLHLALVANVLTACGGRPRFDRDAVPQFPLEMTFEGEAFADRKFPIDLRPFDADAVDTFLKIELPQAPKPPQPMVKDLVVPALTIGEFYQKIVDLLEHLAAADPAGLFTGNPAWQVETDYYWSGGGRLAPVHDLASAKAALTVVIDQGEGAWETPGALLNMQSHFEMGHYYRFNQIAHRRRYRPDDDPAAPPTGTPIEVDFAAVDAFRINPVAADYQPGSELATLNDQFNTRYTVMLLQLQEAFSGTPKTLYTAIMDSMHELTPLAHRMMRLPYPGDGEGRTGCPTFDWTPLRE